MVRSSHDLITGRGWAALFARRFHQIARNNSHQIAQSQFDVCFIALRRVLCSEKFTSGWG
jgi:hypothetical protein